MKLTQSSSDDDYCLICMTNPQDSKREDGYCVECGEVADYYEDYEDKMNLSEGE